MCIGEFNMTPDNFTRCERRGGKIVSIKPRADVVIPVCYPTSGGSPVHGEVKKVESKIKDGE
jgi:hypothetical protein